MPSRKYQPYLDPEAYRAPLLAILRAIVAAPSLDAKALTAILRQYPKDGTGFFRREDLVRAYRTFAGQDGLPPFDPAVLERIRLKPARTASGVTPVTVLTKPFPCPGECIFCPNDVRMPKSYLSQEPGALRAEQNSFDPYLQTFIRLQAYHNTGHPVDKIEMIVLGGTWSFYPESYQVWYVKRIFDALNAFSQGPEVARAEAERVEDLLRAAVPAPPGQQPHPRHGGRRAPGADLQPGRAGRLPGGDGPLPRGGGLLHHRDAGAHPGR